MLTQIAIQNFALVKSLQLDFNTGMTVITGETGAGKSIILDALGLTLGDRGDASWVRPGCDRAEISARFSLNQHPEAITWLQDQDLDDDSGECLLRRVISKEGRSRGYINGTPCTLAQLRELGQQLINIHGQHEHHSLLQADYQRQLLDLYAGAQPLQEQLQQRYQRLRQLAQERQRLLQLQNELKGRAELLRYQVEELALLAPREGEFEELELEHQQLSHAEQNLYNCHQLLNLCEQPDQPSLLALCGQAEQLLSQLQCHHPDLADAPELLGSARIQLEELCHNLNRFVDGFEADPVRLQEVEQRIGALYQQARKHQCQPEQLPEHLNALSTELAGLDACDDQLHELQTQERQAAKDYRALAEKLSKQRQRFAKSLARAVTEHMQALGMAGGYFNIALLAYGDNKARPYGQEEVEFRVMTNPGHPEQALSRVASGGELSRVSLAIQVICAQTAAIPALVFDEVDVGIGGPTAEKIGRLLRQLSSSGQVLCVTHQPQVAAQGHCHMHVHKLQGNRTTHSQVRRLEGEERIAELARMIAGEQLTEHSLAHAAALLEQALEADTDQRIRA